MRRDRGFVLFRMTHDIMSAVITERPYNHKTTWREASGQAVTLLAVLRPKVVAYGVNISQISHHLQTGGTLLLTGRGMFGLFLDM